MHRRLRKTCAIAGHTAKHNTTHTTVLPLVSNFTCKLHTGIGYTNKGRYNVNRKQVTDYMFMIVVLHNGSDVHTVYG